MIQSEVILVSEDSEPVVIEDSPTVTNEGLDDSAATIEAPETDEQDEPEADQSHKAEIDEITEILQASATVSQYKLPPLRDEDLARDVELPEPFKTKP